MNAIIDETTQTKYVVKVNGQIVSPTFPTKFLAEQNIKLLAPENRSIAEIVPVTADGKEMLFG